MSEKSRAMKSSVRLCKPSTAGTTAMTRAILQASLKKSSESPKEVSKKSIKFTPEFITESEDVFRKKVLWHLQDCRFRAGTSSETWKVYICTDFQLPESVTVPRTISQYKMIVLCMEARSSIEAKFPGELKFMVLNNEVSLHHKSTGPVYQILKAGYRLIVPPNKRFYFFNKDVTPSHLLLFLPLSFDSSSKLPKFLL